MFSEESPSPEEVNKIHTNSDVDTSPLAQHHTLGLKPNQAAPGDLVAQLIARIEALEA